MATTHLTIRLLAALAAVFLSLTSLASANGLGFGVTPENSPKGHLLFDAEPGETVRGALLLTNTQTKPVRVALRRQDGHSAATGGLDYKDPKAGGVGEWLELAETRIELAPGQSVRVPLTARIPAGARPGDHFAGVVAYNASELARVQRQQGGRGMQLRFISRFAVAVQFRLPGDAVSSISADDATIETTPSGAAIVVPLHNDGQLLITGAKGQVTVTRDGKKLFTEPVQVGAFIPGGRIRHAVRFRETPGEGTYHVSGFIHPAEGKAVAIDDEVTFGRGHSETLEDRSGQQVVRSGTPWWVWAAAALMVLLGALLVVPFLRWKRAHRRASSPPVAAPPARLQPQPIAPAADPGFTATIIDINTADHQQLQLLPGIGPAAAARIVAHREEYGSFDSLDSLLELPGFDPARVKRLADRAIMR